MVLVLELTSTRLFAYIGSSHATSTALSVALLGLGIGAAARLRWPRVAEPRWMAPGLAAALLVLAMAATLGAPLAVLVLVSLVPFALAGALVSGAYAVRGGEQARATYAIDLASAALGCLVAPRLIGPLAPTEIIAALGLVTSALAISIAAGRGAAGRGAIAVAVLNVALLVAARAGVLPDGPLAVLLGSAAHGEKAIVDVPTAAEDIVDSAWSPLGRLDVRRAPDDRLGVFTDGMSPTYMVAASGAKEATFEDTWGLLMSLPYRALRPARVLVLGAGAGASVWLAKKYGAERVDAVEVNPAISGVLARWTAFAGDVYAQPGVRLVIEDARRFLADTDERYDLIELALALTGNVHAQASGMEAHLYTVEAVRLFVSRLTSNGALVLIHSDAGNAYRQLLTVIEALDLDRARALERIAVLRDPRPGTAYRYLIVVRASPMPLEIVDGLDVEPAELLWGPGDPVARGETLLDPSRLGLTRVDDFSPVHDARPYFFQNTKGLVATAIAEPGRLWVLLGALVLVLVLTVERREDGTRAVLRRAGVAASLGAAFLGVELALIQRFTLAAGGTLYAVSFVLFCLLAWSAAGALGLGGRWRGIAHGVAWACVAAALAVVATALVVRDLAWLDGIASSPARLAAIALLLAPVGLAIGCPFPLLLGQEAEGGRIARLWAINGAASVGGAIVGVLALRVGGSTHALALAAALYVVAAGLARR